MLFPFYLLMTLLTVLLLMAFLSQRLKGATPGMIWGITLLLPLLAAMTVSFSAQAKAQKVLEGYLPTRTVVILRHRDQEEVVSLPPMDSACLAQALRFKSHSRVITPQRDLIFDEQTTVHGFLPEDHFVEALGVLGKLRCKQIRGVLIE